MIRPLPRRSPVSRSRSRSVGCSLRAAPTTATPAAPTRPRARPLVDHRDARYRNARYRSTRHRERQTPRRRDTAVGTTVARTETVTLVAYDSFVSDGTSIGTALDAFTDDDRHRRRDPHRRRRRHDAVARPSLTAGQPRGRRDVGRRQHAALASRRRRACSTRTWRPASSTGRSRSTTPSRRSSRTARRRPSTTATSASTTTSAGSPSAGSNRRRHSPIWPTRRTPACSSSRTRRRRRPAWRSCSPRSPSTASTGGRPTGASCGANGVEVVDELDPGVLRAVHVGGWRPDADGRQLRLAARPPR